MHLIPWISVLLAVAVAISPLGQDVIRGLSSGEALSRSIGSFVATVIACGALVLAAIEVGIRALVRRRRTNGRPAKSY